jgi:hypothetical protein
MMCLAACCYRCCCCCACLACSLALTPSIQPIALRVTLPPPALIVKCRTVLQLPLLELQLEASEAPSLLALQQPLPLPLLLSGWLMFDCGGPSAPYCATSLLDLCSRLALKLLPAGWPSALGLPCAACCSSTAAAAASAALLLLLLPPPVTPLSDTGPSSPVTYTTTTQQAPASPQ